MLKELPWAMCPKCEQTGYLEGDSCRRCGWYDDDDKPGSIIYGTIMEVNGGVPKTRNSRTGTADIMTNSIGFYIFKKGYSFYEIDHILRLELGESFTMKSFVAMAECYEIRTWIKIAN